MNQRFGKILRGILIVISIVVILIGLYYSIDGIEHEKNVMSSLGFTSEFSGEKITFSLWKSEKEDTYYMVLPSAYNGLDFKAEVSYDDRFYAVAIDDRVYHNGDLWTESLKEEVHKLKLMDVLGNIYMEKSFQILVSENVPSIMVTVDAKKELYSKEEYSNKQYLEKGHIFMLDEKGTITLDDQMERFKVRGNLTSQLEKKPFTFTLSKSASLCGMAEAKNWHLLANATDGAHIRNQIMLDWAGELSEGYHPKGEFVDLFLNGEYQGLYFLTETVEVGEGRLNMDSGKGLLLEMELDYRAKLEENPIVTDKEHYWVVHEENSLLETTLQEITDYLSDIESALYAKDGVSENSGKKLEELLDFDSWTDTWLLKEVSSDHDLGTTSQFGIIENWENRSILLAGPEWDFDGTLGNGMVPWSVNPRNLVTAIPNTKGIKSVNQNKWLSQMYQNEEFKALLIQKFQAEIQPKIKRLLEFEIDEYADAIKRPALLDSLRWLGNGVNHYFATPENFSIGEERDYHKYDVLDYHIEDIKRFLKEKEMFLKELWVDGVEFEVLVEEHNEPGMNLELNNNIYTWIPKN